MLSAPEEIEEGQTVHLYPQNKQASRNVHRMLAVTVLKDPKAHWPMVVVGWTEGGRDYWELVHRDNIRKKATGAVTTKQEKGEGDTVGSAGSRRPNRVRVMPSAKKYEPTDGQETLF